MARNINTLLKSGSIALLSIWIAGCASGPSGTNFNSAGSMSPIDGTSANSGGESINAALKPITPQLVKAEQERREKQVSQDITRLLGKPAPYVIDSGDVLSIVVWDHPELSSAATTAGAGPVGAGADAATSASAAPPAGFIVDHDGVIQFPFAGELKVGGLTQDQASSLLVSRLSKYLRQPKITLRVQSFRSKRVYVDGAVRTPGLQAINDIPMTLVEALNRAGGVLPTGDQSQVLVQRRDAVYQINLPELVQRGVNPNSILLADGDVIRVKSREESKVFVSGEVVSPRALLMYNGRLTLNEALGEAGGVNPLSGDGSQIYVIRKDANGQTVYQLDGRTPGALAMAEGFELSPKDVIYVAATPLANWNRTISLILPSALSSAFGVINPLR